MPQGMPMENHRQITPTVGLNTKLTNGPIAHLLSRAMRTDRFASMAPSAKNSVLILADLRGAESGGNPAGADGVLSDADGPKPDGTRVCSIQEPAHVSGGNADGWFLGYGEITNRALIETATRSGLTILLDTTGATLKEVVRAVGWHQLAFRAGTPSRGGSRLCGASLILMHGVVGDAPWNLRALAAMHTHTFQPCGLIDTTRDGLGALAVAAGVVALIRRPAGLAGYAAGVRAAEGILGNASKTPDGSELAAVHSARRRVVAARDLKAGKVLEPPDLRFDQPGPAAGELSPFQAESVIGRVLACHVTAGESIRVDALAGEAPTEAPWFSPRPPREPPGE